MATALPALRGEFGKTEYFLTAMNIGEFLRNVRFPQELPGWDVMSIEDKFQREISFTRVRDAIAPYFASDPDRFSSALVLAVMNHEDMKFEPLSSMGGVGGRGGGGGSSVPQLYQSAARDMGFLTLQGTEILVPLDGQHRAKAFQFAIEGSDNNGRNIPGLKSNPDLAKDQVAVILVRFEERRSRFIFNKLNRYAKPTTKSDNLITDDDDALAVITRGLIGKDGVLPAQMVRIGGNTLTASAREFTTLSTFYECNTALAKGLKLVGSGKITDMPPDQRDILEEELKKEWQRLFDKVDLWRAALSDTSEKGDLERIRIREETLLGKPIGQLSVIQGYMTMREKCVGVSEDDLCNRINRIDWDVKTPMWHGVLMNPNGRVMSGRGTVNLARQFIAHLGGVRLTEKENEDLLELIHGETWQEHSLPDPVA